MPLVDRRTNSVVLRIVYDGPPDAGKATNLRQLCDRLALRPRAAAEPGPDRAQFFDWLDVAGGPIGGGRVRCQLVAVPGQLQLAPRRRHILDSADAVVFVADSQTTAEPQTNAALRALTHGLRTRADVPLVLQANKQDLPRAQTPGDLHTALGLAARVPAVAAQATGGAGVVETFLLAVRLAVDHVRALLVGGELDDGDPATAAGLLAALEADAPDVFVALAAIEARTGAAASEIAPPCSCGRGSGRFEAAGGPTPDPAQLEMPFVGTDADPTWDAPAVEPGAAVAADGRREAARREAARREAARREAGADEAGPAPPSPSAEPPGAAIASDDPATAIVPISDSPFRLPQVDLPAGMVWPGVSGRAALAALAARGTPVRVSSRVSPWAPTSALELTCGDRWLAHTSPHLAFTEPDPGWPALLEAIRWHAKLNYLAAPGRTYALAPEGGGVRLWVLTPVYRTVWVAIEDAFARGDRATATRLTRTGLEAVDELRARGLPIVDLDHIAVDEPLRFLATPWTPRRDRLTAQLQRLLSESVL